MSKFTIEIKGVEGLEKALLEKNEEILDAMKLGVNYGAALVEEEAKMEAPVITGNLVRSIMTDFSDDELEAVIGPDMNQAPYAHYVEFGRSRSGKIPPYPFAGRHYMEHSFNNTKDEVQNLIRGLIERAIK